MIVIDLDKTSICQTPNQTHSSRYVTKFKFDMCPGPAVVRGGDRPPDSASSCGRGNRPEEHRLVHVCVASAQGHESIKNHMKSCPRAPSDDMSAEVKSTMNSQCI